MRRFMAMAVGALLLIPAAAQGQVEIGLDAGLTLDNGFDTQDDITTFSVPQMNARIGFPAGEGLSIETLFGLNRQSSDGNSVTLLTLLPGLNYQLNEKVYLRGELGLQRVSFESGSVSQLGFGAAVGTKQALGDSPVMWRLEGGLTRWSEDSDPPGNEAFNRIRLLFGISAPIN